jgi:hypothetical protein
LAILARSFRLVTARLIPGHCRCKQALLVVVALILAGCGGSSAPKAHWQRVDAGDFHFRAPKGWSVTVTRTRTTVKDGSSFVQVATFPLVRAYTGALFEKVRSELDLRMAAVAKQSGGAVAAHRVVTVDGIRSHQYDVRVGKRVDRYTFVLRGKRELLLLCSADAAVCDELAASFVAG